MIAIARERIPGATFVVGDALDLPFGEGAFDRVFTKVFGMGPESVPMDPREFFSHPPQSTQPRTRDLGL